MERSKRKQRGTRNSIETKTRIQRVVFTAFVYARALEIYSFAKKDSRNERRIQVSRSCSFRGNDPRNDGRHPVRKPYRSTRFFSDPERSNDLLYSGANSRGFVLVSNREARVRRNYPLLSSPSLRSVSLCLELHGGYSLTRSLVRSALNGRDIVERRSVLLVREPFPGSLFTVGSEFTDDFRFPRIDAFVRR